MFKTACSLKAAISLNTWSSAVLFSFNEEIYLKRRYKKASHHHWLQRFEKTSLSSVKISLEQSQVMKIAILLCLFATLVWGCPNFPLPKLAACNLSPNGDCSCQKGLACRLTKELIYKGQVIPVKQCMPIDMIIEVEQVNIDEAALGRSNDFPDRRKRFLFNKCTTDAECRHNFCCAFGKRCAPKLLEFFTCYYVGKHKCGCREGLVCKQTTSIQLPIWGTKFPIKQCVKPEEPPAP